MSDFQAQLSRLKVGDIVRVVDTARVESVTDYSVTLADVETGKVWLPWSAGTTRIEMVKKAAKPVKAGDILTGQEIRDRQWKRGTVIQCVEKGDYYLSPLVLNPWGNWRDYHLEKYEFEDLVADAKFKILHVA